VMELKDKVIGFKKITMLIDYVSCRTFSESKKV